MVVLIGRCLLLIITLSGLTLSVESRFSEVETKKFINKMLFLHNETRETHNVKSLIHVKEMDKLAKDIHQQRKELNILCGMDRLWCKYFQRNEPGKKEVALESEYGINRYVYESFQTFELDGDVTAKEVFSKWYQDDIIYDYNKEPISMETGPFTQILWKGTKKIGISIQQCADNKFEIIVLYKPPGNIPGEYTLNVLMPKSTDSEESSESN